VCVAVGCAAAAAVGVQVCDIVVESPDPHIACRRVLDAALYEWEERMSADNITVLVVEFEWNEDSVAPTMEHATATAFRWAGPARDGGSSCVPVL
jgi:hypothetical protein